MNIIKKLFFASLIIAFSAASSFSFEPKKTTCIAPANAGGGWDFACRAVGKTLQDLKIIPGTMEVINLAGGGGGVAFSEVVNKRGKDSNLIVAASSATSTRLAQNAYPGNNMNQVKWLASVGADYGIIAVAANSKLNTLPELLDLIKKDPSKISIGGGSAVGGWDHLKVLLAAKKYGIKDVKNIKYISFDGGGTAITQLLAGSVQVFTGDISEAKGFVDAGNIKILAVLSPEKLPGEFAKFPTAKSQGVDVIGANWRGFYVPKGMTDDAYKFWVNAIGKVYDSAEWKATMKQSGLAPLNLRGKDFEKFVAQSVKDIAGLSKEIGLIK